MSMGTRKTKIKKILKDLESLKKDSKIRFAFSYVEMGKTLSDLDAEVVHNIQDDLCSETLLYIIEDKIFENLDGEKTIDDVLEEKETMAKLHMFNLFNKGKKYKA
jgi:hypothetical protein